MGLYIIRRCHFPCDHIGTALNYEVLGMSVSSVRSGAKLGRKWKKRIEDDYASR